MRMQVWNMLTLKQKNQLLARLRLKYMINGGL